MLAEIVNTSKYNIFSHIFKKTINWGKKYVVCSVFIWLFIGFFYPKFRYNLKICIFLIWCLSSIEILWILTDKRECTVRRQNSMKNAFEFELRHVYNRSRKNNKLYIKWKEIKNPFQKCEECSNSDNINWIRLLQRYHIH